MTDRKFRIEDLTLGTLTFEDMTLGDMEDLMAAAELDLVGLGGLEGKQFTRFPPRALSAFIWVENRRNMEGLKLSDCRNIPGPKLFELLGLDDDDEADDEGEYDNPKELLTNNSS